jgi:hypothetical protein
MRRINDDNLDEHGLLKDGHSLRVRMSMMDSVQTAVARQQIVDGAGRRYGLHQPGYRLNDTFSDRQRIYDQYDAEKQNEWRNPPTGAGERGQRGAKVGEPCTCKGEEYSEDFGSPGHYAPDRNGELICVPDRIIKQQDHQTTMQAVYDAYERELTQAWRR